MTHVHYRHKRSRGKRLINRAGAEGHDPTFANSFARSIIICNLNLSDLPASLFWEHQIVESADWKCCKELGMASLLQHAALRRVGQGCIVSYQWKHHK